MKKDWTGNSASLFVCNGASNHSLEERADLDFTRVHGTNLKYVEKDSSGPQFPYLHNELS